MKKRSVGVTILGILFIVNGAFGLMGAVAVPTLERKLQSISEEDKATLSPTPRAEITAVQVRLRSPGYRILFAGSTAIHTVTLLAGIGLFALFTAGYWLTVGALVASLVWAFGWTALDVATGRLRSWPQWIWFCLALAWNGGLLWYVRRPSVKAQFVSKER